MNRIPTCTTFLMVSHTEETTPAMLSQIVVKVVFTAVQAEVIALLIVERTVVTVVVILFQIFAKKSLMPFQVSEKKVLMLSILLYTFFSRIFDLCCLLQ